ncbi:MAG TPA: hypothetical protein VJ902_00335 [Wenzhouxiangellaceae bacterium]|nr:hypothetical protein [Wenzhouxiangellaceae bacterium]
MLIDNSNASARGATVMQFLSKEKSAFVNRGGQAMKTVPLNRGNNGFRLRDDSGPCAESEGGCKYDVISDGGPKLDPRVIIWE